MVGVRQAGVRQKDILLGRGPACYNHPGNVKFRSCLRVHVSCYEKEASHREKRAMVQHLIAELQDKRRCRFLRFCSKKVKWVQASLQQVKAKIEHGLRDARQQLADESYPDTPSWTPQKCVPAINDLHDKRDSQRPEFVNATRHSRSESLSMSRMHMIPIQETAFTHESCARRASCKYSWYENTTTKRNTTLPESPSYSYVFDGIESDQDLTKIAELEGSTSSLSFESDDDLTEMQELERSISPMSFESDEDLTKMAEEKFKHGQGVAARLVRPNILDFQPSRCARDDISEGIFHVADENTISPTSIPTNSLDPHGQKLRLERNSDPYQFSLKEKYAAHRGHGLTPANIFAGVGSDPAIDLLMRIFCRPSVDNVLVTPPTYGIYKVCAKVNDVEIISCPLSKDLSLRVPEVRIECVDVRHRPYCLTS